MNKIGIRDLTAERIRASVDQRNRLGVTNNGALVGVLFPATQQILKLIVAQTAGEIVSAISEAEFELAQGHLTSSLDDLITSGDTAGAAPLADRDTDMPIIGIRDLSGSRLERAAQEGEILTIASDNKPIAVFIPIRPDLADNLVERHLNELLSGPIVLSTRSAPRVRAVETVPPASQAVAPVQSHLQRHPFAGLYAIGIAVVGSESEGDRSLVGVATNPLAQVIDGPVIARLTDPSEAHLVQEVEGVFRTLVYNQPSSDVVMGLGIEMGGHVHDGRIIQSANSQWKGFSFAERLRHLFRIPVVLENDANSLAIYERLFHGEDYDNLAVVLLTYRGVGSGLIQDGEIRRGHNGMAGELGHVPLDLESDGPDEKAPVTCRCGNARCLEAVASPYAIDAALKISGYAGGYSAAIVETAEDPIVKRIFSAAGRSLGRGIATIINLLNPAAFVIYGPIDLIGPPRDIYITRDDAGYTGRYPSVRAYISSMVSSVLAHSFSTGTDRVRFVVRTNTTLHCAQAAAACLIHELEVRGAGAYAASQSAQWIGH